MEQFIADNAGTIVPIVAVILSEIIGMSGMKSNSLIQLIVNILKATKKNNK